MCTVSKWGTWTSIQAFWLQILFSDVTVVVIAEDFNLGEIGSETK